MTVSLSIKNVPNDLSEKLRHRALKNHRSLQRELMAILEEALNALIRNLLEQTVKTDSTQWLDECFALMDRANIRSKGKRWKREDL